MSQHLAILKGPQGEKIPVICSSEAEARNIEAADEARKLKTKTERRTVENIDDEEEQEICPTCGRPKLAAEEEDDEV
jgi:hypothetical protein